ncbi:hypothetical protein NC651_025210 [Populus alba x Populus x berolinensis]|nr:hypothetical protein NC651_025210 [Populus alba x Populus x berolinensis]
MVFGKRTLDSAEGRKLPGKEQPTRCPDQNAARHCERKDCVHFKLGFLFVGPNGGFIQGHLRLSLIAYDNWSTEGLRWKGSPIVIRLQCLLVKISVSDFGGQKGEMVVN